MKIYKILESQDSRCTFRDCVQIRLNHKYQVVQASSVNILRRFFSVYCEEGSSSH